MEIVWIVLLLSAGAIIYNQMYRKRMYREIDRLEGWKIELMNRPVPDELAKVKQLNMTGETERLFERWRQQWDEIVAVKLPDVEEQLFDAETLLDKYRYRQARKLLGQMEDGLRRLEEEVHQIIHEVNELIGSEEQNRAEIEELRAAHREAKKTLLAYRYTFGAAADLLDVRLSEAEKQFQSFAELTEAGNYLAARDVVLLLKQELDRLTAMMEEIPVLLGECQTSLPAQLAELADGYQEMEQSGYILDHLHIERALEEKQEKIKQCLAMIGELRIEEAKQTVAELKEEIDTLYDLLEKEVLAHRYVQTEMPRIGGMLKELAAEAKETGAEAVFVQQSYHLPPGDLEKYRSIEKQLHQLQKRFLLIEERAAEAKTAYSLLREELEQLVGQIGMMKEEHEQFRVMLQTLRKDELIAREKLDDMRKQLSEALRLVQKSRLPGLPESYALRLTEARNSLQNVAARLDEKPLDMPSVDQALEEAKASVERLYERTIEMIEQAALAERTIQYGNRYRRRYPAVHKGLEEAEFLFRHYDYEEALRQAVATIESVEPGAFDRVQQLWQTDNEEER
ncbi:septation ring formation regulator EzrA [Geobacillus subterraneus]|uniref:Septation ring formation regulator EzrA n=2 Tax=Geobacillus TaxID=129337 RepID=A0ABN4NDG1_9BACL|nr:MULTISPECIES: septation ring formation regulator EzrA [Geobacillus]AMX82590.1 septation ring formation regulator EzrA [Geobacillus subterraneus]KZS26329.1 septation ring formation regulator EzrA [Geobacillus subterraneus]OXB90679.1 septation ring formation regulator EzrA [Geobacillus uzenensis]QIZ68687.1 septation ring formation regulator EzrA [Geobacillus subterraneus]WPZ17711.1 septation ring formation regulator EzrA [Geobacillus subterraneus]